MNNDNPLVPRGSLLEQKTKSQSRVKTAFFCVLAVHVLAILTALIAQGCKREQPTEYQLPPEPVAPTPVFDTNFAPVVDTTLPPPPVETNEMSPILEPIPPPPVPPAATEYTVASGDTFYGIGKRFGLSMKAIADANPGLDPNRLQVGQKLNLPATPPATPGGTTASPAVDLGGQQIYVVKSGDNLTKIARKYGITVSALRSENNLRTDRIRVGDKLKIPASAAPPAAAPAPTASPMMPEPFPAPPPAGLPPAR